MLFSTLFSVHTGQGRLSSSFYNPDRDRVDLYPTDTSSSSSLSLSQFGEWGSPGALPLVPTSDARAAQDCIMSWLRRADPEPFLLVG